MFIEINSFIEAITIIPSFEEVSPTRPLVSHVKIPQAPPPPHVMYQQKDRSPIAAQVNVSIILYSQFLSYRSLDFYLNIETR